MRKLSLLAGVAMLVLSAPMAALAQGNGDGKGQGGGGRGAEHRNAPDKGKGDRADAAAKARGNGGGQARVREARANGRPDRREVRRTVAGARRPGSDRPRAEHVADRRGANRDGQVIREPRGRENGRNIVIDQREEPNARIIRASGDRDRNRVRFRRYEGTRYRWEPAWFDGCPPGLAKKGNGCLPPGQARRIAYPRGAAVDPDTYWYRYASWYEPTPRYDWRYSDGYAYRVEPSTGLIASFLPLLGGALYPGEVWPASYTAYDVDPYYDRYYGFEDPYDYRYADGALLAVDPETQAIAAIAALLTGDDWLVGSPMPIGYDAYNVPPLYRDRYYDTDDAWYRYSDGYVYRVEPRTRIVRETILLPV